MINKIILVVLLMFMIPLVSSADVILSELNQDTDQRLRLNWEGGGVHAIRAQTFTVGVNGTNTSSYISSFDIHMYKRYDLDTNFTFNIYNTNSTQDIVGSAVSTTPVPAAILPTLQTSNAWTLINLTSLFSVQPGVTYAWAFINTTTLGSGTPQEILANYTTTELYSGGKIFRQNDGGNWFDEGVTGDFLFRAIAALNVTQDGDTATTEEEQETFKLHLNKTSIGSGTATLNWANLTYTPNITRSYADSLAFEVIINIPSGYGSLVGVNHDWNWTYSLDDATIVNGSTENQTQTVYTFALDDCSSFTNILLNYTIYDEDTRSFLTNSTYNVTSDLTVTLSSVSSGEIFANYSSIREANPIEICSASNLTDGENYYLDSTIQFQTDEHVTEHYYITDHVINLSTMPLEISLYDLLITRSQEFLITFKDTNFLPVPDAIIEITRQYLDINQFLTVEIGKTDYDGRTIAHLVLNDELYTIYVKSGGAIRATYNNVRAFCDDISTGDCRINLNELGGGTDIEDFDTYKDVTITQGYNDTDKEFVISFTSTDGVSKHVELNVTKFDVYNNITICTTSVTSSSGTLTCVIPSTYYNNTAIAKVYVGGEQISQFIFDISDLDEPTADKGRFIIAFIYLLTIALIAVATPTVGLVLFIVAIPFVGSIFLLDVGPLIGGGSVTLWVLICVIILLFKASRRDN